MCEYRARYSLLTSHPCQSVGIKTYEAEMVGHYERLVCHWETLHVQETPLNRDTG